MYMLGFIAKQKNLLAFPVRVKNQRILLSEKTKMEEERVSAREFQRNLVFALCCLSMSVRVIWTMKNGGNA